VFASQAVMQNTIKLFLAGLLSDITVGTYEVRTTHEHSLNMC